MNTKFVTYCRSMALAASFLLVTPFSSLSADYVSVIKDEVNVRTGPGTNNPIRMELFQGYPLKVLQKRGDWFEVSDFENDKGWIYASLVSSDKKTVIISAKNRANMRTSPSTSGQVIAKVDRGVVLTLLERQGKWVKVQHNGGSEGWVYAPLVWP